MYACVWGVGKEWVSVGHGRRVQAGEYGEIGVGGSECRTTLTLGWSDT